MTKDGQVNRTKKLLVGLVICAILIVLMVLYHYNVYPLQDLFILLGR